MRSWSPRQPRTIRRTPAEQLFDAANLVFMVILSFVMLYPFWYVIVYSLNESQNARAGGLWFWPREITLSNYRYVIFNRVVANSYFITIARTVLGSSLHLVVTGLAAYALSKRFLPGRKAITYFLITPMFIGGTIVSNYVVIAKLQLLNNFLVYVLPGAFSFFMMAIARAFIEGIPASIEESAKMDGAGYLRIFVQLIIPLCMPIIATILIFAGVGHWLDFYSNLLYVNDQKLFVLQFLLYRLVQASTFNSMAGAMNQAAMQSMRENQITAETVKMTTLVVITVPILFIYPFFQKYIVKGVLIGAIKE